MNFPLVALAAGLALPIFGGVLGAQGSPRGMLTAEIGAEWSNAEGFEGPGVNLGLFVRPTQKRWQLAGEYSWLGSAGTRGQVPSPTAGMLDVVTESSDQLGSLGVRLMPYQHEAGRSTFGLALGLGAAVRHVRSIVTLYDSTGAVNSRSDNSTTLWGPRTELLGMMDWRMGRRFSLGLAVGPTLMFGAGAGENGELGGGVLSTWVLKGRIGF